MKCAKCGIVAAEMYYHAGEHICYGCHGLDELRDRLKGLHFDMISVSARLSEAGESARSAELSGYAGIVGQWKL